MDVFISWSGDESKQVALALKSAIEEFFSDNGIEVFVSESDIGAGKRWFQVIGCELRACKVGILCLTSFNTDAPWLCFEAGALAMSTDERSTIPLLLKPAQISERSPFSSLNYVQWSFDGFCKVLKAIADACSVKMGIKRIKRLSRALYDDVDKVVEEMANRTRSQVPFNKRLVYPKTVGVILRSSVFLCGPMASLGSEDAYKTTRNLMMEIADALQEKGFSPTYYGGSKIGSTEEFDESIKSVKDNFRQFKQSEFVVVVYPEALPSSVLVEIGYAIALSKPTVIFTRSRSCLPFLLKDIDKTLTNVSVFEYADPQEILKKVRGNGRALFLGE